MSSSNQIAVIGAPFDSNSSYQQGASLAPSKIKEALFCDSSNLWTEGLVDLGARTDWSFKSDMQLKAGESERGVIEQTVSGLLGSNSKVIALGGDHSITYPILRAYAKHYNSLNILHFDAHPDLYDQLEGNRYSHASPFARIMEEHLAVRLVQVGIRTMNGHQRAQADRFGVEVIDMKNISAAQDLSFESPTYVSIDIDCLDPAFAPGVSHHEPGGMSTREVLTILQQTTMNIVGADIVELNPERDINGMTSMVAAKLLKELLGKMLA